MSKHNYSQYSNKKNTNKVVEEEIQVSEQVDVAVAEEVVAPIAPVAPVEMVVETVDTVELPKTVTGVVSNCTKLNVREKPMATANVVCVVNGATELKIDVAKSTDEWFRVCTATGAEGYCMRKFVEAHL